MKPRLSFVTLAVDDLDRAVAFYRDGLGFDTKGVVGSAFEHGAVAFFDCEGGLKLALWPRDSLAAESGVPIRAAGGPQGSLAQNVGSEAEVRAVVERAQRAGARVVAAPAATFYGGYAGYFQDPDGHLWEIAFNPGYEALG